MSVKPIASFIALLHLVAVVPEVVSEPSGLQQRFEALLKKSSQRRGIRSANVSVMVRELAAPHRMLRWAPTKAMNPASVLKVVTTVAALRTFGADHQFVTEFWSDGKVDSAGQLNGHLYVVGQGDPSLVTEALSRMVLDLRDRGIMSIRGDLVAVDHLLPTLPLKNDFSRSAAYNSAQGALSLNYNHLQIWVHPQRQGQSAKILLDPPLESYLSVRNRTTTTRGSKHTIHAEVAKTSTGTMVVQLRGSIGEKAKPLQLYRPVPDPSRYFLHSFAHFFKSYGGTLHGTLKSGSRPSSASLLYKRKSEMFLSQVLILMNKYSNNFLADQLTLLLGAKRSGQPGSLFASGVEQLQKTLIGKGAATSVHLVNGSGLARQNRVSAEHMVGLLAEAYDDATIRPELMASLTLFGQDGTTRDRPRLAVPVRTKTGGLRGVSTLVGYIPAHKGAPRLHNATAFAILINQQRRFNRTQSRRFQEDILRFLIEQMQAPPPAKL